MGNYTTRPKRWIVGTYAGDSTNSRQITTGFIVGHVRIISTQMSVAWPNAELVLHGGGAILHMSSFHDASIGNAGLALHASDGFIVGNASGTDYAANKTGEDYYYYAIED